MPAGQCGGTFPGLSKRRALASQRCAFGGCSTAGDGAARGCATACGDCNSGTARSACAALRGSTKAAHREADQRDPLRLPFGFHRALRRRAAGRTRRARVPRTQSGGGVAILPNCSRRDWRRCAEFGCAGRRRGHSGRRRSCGAAAGRSALHPTAAAARGDHDFAHLRCRSAQSLRRCPARRRPHHRLPRPQRSPADAGVPRRAVRDRSQRSIIACSGLRPCRGRSGPDLAGPAPPCYRSRHVSPRHRLP